MRYLRSKNSAHLTILKRFMFGYANYNVLYFYFIRVQTIQYNFRHLFFLQACHLMRLMPWATEMVINQVAHEMHSVKLKFICKIQMLWHKAAVQWQDWCLYFRKQEKSHTYVHVL